MSIAPGKQLDNISYGMAVWRAESWKDAAKTQANRAVWRIIRRRVALVGDNLKGTISDQVKRDE